MNKNIKVEYKIDKFTDFAGIEREFILAAVSVPILAEDIAWIPSIDSFNGIDYDDEMMMKCEKLLLIGISVRNAEDPYNEEIGKRIAMGKALKFKGKQLVANHAGLINTRMVQALLEQEAEYFKRDPQSYIAGYNEAKRKWEQKRKQSGN